MATLPPVPTVTIPAEPPTTAPAPANATTSMEPTGGIASSPTATNVPPVPTVTIVALPTMAPANSTTTAVPTIATTALPNDCSSLLEPGDVNTIIFNSDPLDQIVFFSLKDIPSTVGSVFVTDRPWDGENFVTGEGTLEYMIPEDGIKAGSVFGYGVTFPEQSGEWRDSEDEKKFDLSTIGPDSLLVYCLNADNKPFFLSALTYNGNFSEPGKLSYDPSETSLPLALTEVGGLALPFASNYLYNGPTEKGKRDELLAAFYNPTNFQGSIVAFEIDTSTAAGTSPATCVMSLLLGFMVLVLL